MSRMLVLLNQLKTQAKPNWLTDGQLLNHPAATASPPEGGLCKCSPQLQLPGLGLRHQAKGRISQLLIPAKL